ncbi:hypothetical protein K525DRAFT_248929 [Schizophyllum commune Loenen D]|nr:hypothetical protein K525DRAFT_248929 [Schizophyllum commune Loenen D]
MVLDRLTVLRYAVACAVRYDATVRSRRVLADYLLVDDNFARLRDEIRRRWTVEEAIAFYRWQRKATSYQSHPDLPVGAEGALSQTILVSAVQMLGRVYPFLGWQGFYLGVVSRLADLTSIEEHSALRMRLERETEEFRAGHPFAHFRDIFDDQQEYVGSEDPIGIWDDLHLESGAVPGLLV